MLCLAACVVGALMLLTFPIQSAHQYTNHFRTPQVRRTIERGVFIAHPDTTPTKRIAQQAVFPALLVSLNAGDAKPVTIIYFSPVPISRLLMHLKLGFSRSGSEDPLL